MPPKRSRRSCAPGSLKEESPDLQLEAEDDPEGKEEEADEPDEDEDDYVPEAESQTVDADEELLDDTELEKEDDIADRLREKQELLEGRPGEGSSSHGLQDPVDEPVVKVDVGEADKAFHHYKEETDEDEDEYGIHFEIERI